MAEITIRAFAKFREMFGAENVISVSGRILIEAEGVSLEVAREALRLGAQKLPVTTKFVVRRDYVE